MHSFFRPGWTNDPVMTEKPTGSSFPHYMATCGAVSRVLLPAQPIQPSQPAPPPPVPTSLPQQLHLQHHQAHVEPPMKRLRMPSSPPPHKKARTVPAPVLPLVGPTRLGSPVPAGPPSPAPSEPAAAACLAPATQSTPSDAMVDRARRVIRAQFDVEVLLKHRELQRINQEMAKCQATVEQLRRCRLIPYPSMPGLSSTVALGSAPAGSSRPACPAAWGVTDSPYAQHYAAWLLPDPAFEPSATGPAAAINAPLPPSSRSQSFSGFPVDGRVGLPPLSTRSARLSAAAKTDGTDAAPSGPPARDPLVLRRSSDGKLVRLVCNKCQKDQFANVQGFINHYRIQHHYGFKSHDAAALACGQPIDDQDDACVVDTTAQPGLPARVPPAAVHSTVAVPKAAPPPPPPSAMPILTRDAPRLVEPTAAHRLTKPEAHMSELPTAMVKIVESVIQTPATNACKEKPVADASIAAVPHLSSLLQKTGFSGNLSQIVERSMIKIDLSAMSDCELDEAAEQSPVAKPALRSVVSTVIQAPTVRTAESDWAMSSPHGTDSNPGMMTDVDDEADDEVASPARTSKNDVRSTGECGKLANCSPHDVTMVDILFAPTPGIDGPVPSFSGSSPQRLGDGL